MDPLSITAAVASLIVTSAKASACFKAVIDSYANCSSTILALKSECSVITTVLTQIQLNLVNNADTLFTRLNTQNSIATSFDNALTSCTLTLSSLENEIGKLVEANPGHDGSVGFKTRVKFIWKEDIMIELLQQLRGQQSSLHILISILQVESLSEVKDMVQKSMKSLQDVLKRARTFRASSNKREVVKDNESIFGSLSASILYGPTLVLDEELNQSSAYQRARKVEMDRLWKLNNELLEEKFILIDKVDELEEKLDSTEKTAEEARQKLSQLEETVKEKQRELKLRSEWQLSSGDRTFALQLECYRKYDELSGLRLQLRKLENPFFSANGVSKNSVDWLAQHNFTLQQGMDSPIRWECTNREVTTYRVAKEKHIDEKNQAGESALYRAAYYNLRSEVERLITAGADVNISGGRYGFPLQAAATGGYDEIVRILIEAGADVLARGGHYENAFRAAVFNKNLDCVKIICHAGGGDVTLHGSALGFVQWALKTSRVRPAVIPPPKAIPSVVHPPVQAMKVPQYPQGNSGRFMNGIFPRKKKT